MATNTRTRSNAGDEAAPLLVQSDESDGDAFPIGSPRGAFEVVGNSDALPDEFYDALAGLLLDAANSERNQRAGLEFSTIHLQTEPDEKEQGCQTQT